MYSIQTRRQKVSLTIPAELLEFARSRAKGRGGVSSVVSEVLRKERDLEDQERLEQALQLDAEANLEYARAAAPSNAQLVRNLDW